MSVSFELVSPERLLISETVDMVVVPGAEGDFGVLEGHAPLVSTLRPGVITTYAGDTIDKQLFVASGFAEVTGTRCTVLAEEALPVEEISRTGAEERLQTAREALERDGTAPDQAVFEIEVAEQMLAAIDLSKSSI